MNFLHAVVGCAEMLDFDVTCHDDCADDHAK